MRCSVRSASGRDHMNAEMAVDLARCRLWPSACDKIAATPSRGGVCPSGDRLVELVPAANGDRPERVKLNVATTAREEIPMRVLATPNPKVAMFAVGALFELGALLGAVVRR